MGCYSVLISFYSFACSLFVVLLLLLKSKIMDRYTIREQIIECFKLCANEISNAQSINAAYSILDNFANNFSPFDTNGYYKRTFIPLLYKI